MRERSSRQSPYDDGVERARGPGPETAGTQREDTAPTRAHQPRRPARRRPARSQTHHQLRHSRPRTPRLLQPPQRPQWLQWLQRLQWFQWLPDPTTPPHQPPRRLGRHQRPRSEPPESPESPECAPRRQDHDEGPASPPSGPAARRQEPVRGRSQRQSPYDDDGQEPCRWTSSQSSQTWQSSLSSPPSRRQPHLRALGTPRNRVRKRMMGLMWTRWCALSGCPCLRRTHGAGTQSRSRRGSRKACVLALRRRPAEGLNDPGVRRRIVRRTSPERSQPRARAPDAGTQHPEPTTVFHTGGRNSSQLAQGSASLSPITFSSIRNASASLASRNL